MAVFRVIPEGDLDIVDGDLVTITGPEYTRQKLASKFRFFLGEWFLDQREGIPYYRDVFVKNPNLEVIRSIFRQVLLKTPGVASLVRFDLKYDAAARTLSFDFEVKADDGTAIVVTPTDTLFIIQV